MSVMPVTTRSAPMVNEASPTASITSKHGLQEVAEGGGGVGIGVSFRKLENELLGKVYGVLYVRGVRRRQLGDLVSCGQQLATSRGVANGASVDGGCGAGRHRVEQAGDVRCSSDTFQRARVCQDGGYGDRVCRPAVGVQGEDRLVDCLVGRLVEV